MDRIQANEVGTRGLGEVELHRGLGEAGAAEGISFQG